jgi:ATP-dependent DNA helicase PIF1
MDIRVSPYRPRNQRPQLRKVRVIIIDKVSMLKAELLNFIAKLFARLHRQVTPFGPVHVILLGDLMQLPPVSGSRFSRHIAGLHLRPYFCVGRRGRLPILYSTTS